MNASELGRGEVVSSGFGQVTVLFGRYRSGDGEDLSRDRSTRGRARRRRSMGGAVSRVLESLEKRTMMAAQELVPQATQVLFQGTQQASSTPVLAVNPVNTRQVVAATVVRNRSASPNTMSLSLAWSNDGGTTFTEALPPAWIPTQINPTIATPATRLTLMTDLSAGFDRNNQLYVTSLERDSTGNVGFLLLRRFDLSSGVPVEVDLNPATPAVDPNIIYGWAGASADAVIHPSLTVNQNVAAFTDPLTSRTLTDPTILNGQNPLYVAFSTDAVAPQNATNFNPNNIVVVGSSDGGFSFSGVQAYGSFTGNARLVTPKVVVSQGAFDNTGSLKVAPGAVTVMYVDAASFNGSEVDALFAVPSTSTPIVSLAAQLSQNDVVVPGAINGIPLPPQDIDFDGLTFPAGMTTATVDNISVKLVLGSTTTDLSTLTVELVAPGGTASIRLFGPGQLSGNTLGAIPVTVGNVTQFRAVGTFFTDDAPRSIVDQASSSPYVGLYRPSTAGPVNNFAAFIQAVQNAPGSLEGTFTLRVTNIGTGAATVRSATLSVSQGGGRDPDPTVEPVQIATTTVRLTGGLSADRQTASSPTGQVGTAGRGVGPGLVVASDNTLGDRVRSFDGTNSYTSQGRIYAAWTGRDKPFAGAPGSDGNEADNTDIFFAFSDDGGSSWSAPTRVNDDAGQVDGFSGAWEDTTRVSPSPGVARLGRPQYNPEIVVDQTTGNLVISWLDARWDAARVRTANYMAVSTNGGLTFLPQTFANPVNKAIDAVTGKVVNLGPVGDNFSSANSVNETFVPGSQSVGIGDRRGLAAANGRIINAWVANDNGAVYNEATGIWSNGSSVPARQFVRAGVTLMPGGPQVVSSDMGAVTRAGSVVSVTSLAGAVTTHTYNGTVGAATGRGLDGFLVTFDRLVLASSFTAGLAKVTYRSPTTTGVSSGADVPLASSNAITPIFEDIASFRDGVARTFLVRLASPQTAVGTYSYQIAPGVRDTITHTGFSNFRDTQAQFVNSPRTIEAGTTDVNGVITPRVTTVSFDVNSSLIPTTQTAPLVMLARARMSLNFPNLTNLTVDLTSPTGTVIRLFQGAGGASWTQLVGTVPAHTGTSIAGMQLSDDAGFDAVIPGQAPYSGPFRTDGSLLAGPGGPLDAGFAAFSGEVANGTWTLTITNNSTFGGAAAGTNAQLGSFTLALQTGENLGVGGQFAVGNAMDQDGNGYGGTALSPGWAVNDLYAAPAPTTPTLNGDGSVAGPFGAGTSPLIVPGPYVIHTEAVTTTGALVQSGGVVANTTGSGLNTGVTGLRVTFDRNIDPTTLTRQAVLSIIGPSGPLTEAQRYASPDRGLAIPDRTTIRRFVTSRVLVSDSYLIGDVNVQLSISHPRVSDLLVTLIGPDGTRVPLVSNTAKTGADYRNTLFDESSTRTLADINSVAPFDAPTGYRTVNFTTAGTGLDVLKLKNSRGEWKLEVEDTVAGTTTATGTLNNWGVLITPDVSSVTVTPDPTDARAVLIGLPTTQSASGSYTVTLASTIRSLSSGTPLDSNLNAGLDKLRGVAVPSSEVVAKTYFAGQGAVPLSVPAGTVASPAVVSSVINIPANENDPFTRIAVQLSITSPDVRGLRAELVAPDGSSVLLFDRVAQAGNRANFQSTVFTDVLDTGAVVGTQITSGQGPFLGTFRPQEPTAFNAMLNRQFSQTAWTLRVTNTSATPATLEGWNLALRRSVLGTNLGEPVADRATGAFRVHAFVATDGTSANSWTPMGPFASSSSGAGRVSSVVLDPSDPSGNTVYAAGASGGVWRTRNFLDNTGTPVWTPLTDFAGAGTLRMGSVAVFGRNKDPDQSVIFAGTGEGATGSAGLGMLRSTDGGRSWALLDSTNTFNADGSLNSNRDFAFVGATTYRVVVDPKPLPNGEVIVYAALGGTEAARGVWRSLDSGRNWARVLTSASSPTANDATDVILDFNSTTIDTINNPSGNVQYVYAAFANDGVYFSQSRGAQWTRLLGGVGNPLKVDDTRVQPFSGQTPTGGDATNLGGPGSGSPNGTDNTRITLARPALTGDPIKDLLYQGWTYALVATTAPRTFPTPDGIAPAEFDGLYLTKDFGLNWVRVALPALAFPVVNNSEFIPTNSVTSAAGDEARVLSRLGSDQGNYNQSLAVDPTNPNVIYVGGYEAYRVDTTGVYDAHAFYIDQNGDANSRRWGSTANGPSQLTNTSTLGNRPGTISPLTSPYINLVQNPETPYVINSTIRVFNTGRITNSGQGAKWTVFAREDLGGTPGLGANDVSTGHHSMVAMVDPRTGQTRVVMGTDSGVYTTLTNADGSPVTQLSNDASPVGSRNGNLQIAQLVEGAAQPGLASQLTAAQSFFLAAGRTVGAIASGPNPLDTGNLTYTGSLDPTSVSTGTLAYSGSLGGADSVAIDQQGNRTLYRLLWPINRFEDNFNSVGSTGVQFTGVSTDFLTVETPETVGSVSRTTGLFARSGQPGVFTGDGQWSNVGGFKLALNPINGNSLLVASRTGRLYSTINQGRSWAVVGLPTQFGLPNLTTASPTALSPVTALAYGAPDPGGAGGIDSTNFLAYVGTRLGDVFVTLRGGGGDQGQNPAWIDLSAGLDGSAVRSISTSPSRGTFEAYAVTERGVYYMPNAKVDPLTNPTPTWINITGNLGQLTSNSFGDPTRPIPAVFGLTSVAADWRYRIQPVAGATVTPANGTFPVLYAAGEGGVFRSLDMGQNWSAFPNIDTDESRTDGGGLPDAEVTDLDLSLGPIDPTTGFPNSSQGENLLMATTYGRGVFAIRVAPVVVPQRLTSPQVPSIVGKVFTSSSRTPSFTGTSAATAFGNTVTVRLLNLADPLNPVVLSSVQTDSFGNFTGLSVPAGTLTTDRTYELGFQAVDARGIVSAPYRITYALDTTAPTAPTGVKISSTVTNDSGRSQIDGVTRIKRPVIEGSGEANASVVVTIRNNATNVVTTLPTTTVLDSGAWTVTPIADLADGVYTVTAVQTDLAGNVSQASADYGLVIDSVSPPAPATPTLDPASDTGRSDSDGVTNDNTPMIRGVAEPGARVTVLVNGAAVSPVVIAGPIDGSWSYPFSTSLPDATYAITSTQEDLAGNASQASGRLSVRIVTATPAAPAVPRVLAADDSGARTNDGITFNANPRITGQVLSQSTVQIFLNGATTPSNNIVVGTNGAFTLPVLSGSNALADGSYTLTLRQVDQAGNTSVASGSYTLVIDTTAPSITVPPGGITGRKGSPFSGNVATFTDANPQGATSEVNFGDNVFRPGSISGTANPFTVTGSTTFARSGTFNYAVRVTDIAGNRAENATGQAGVEGGPVTFLPSLTPQFTEAVTSGPQVVATFTDPLGPEPVESYVAVINWGDNTPDTTVTPSFNGSTGVFTITSTHRYGEDGTYPITITVTTGGTNTAIGSATALVTPQPVTPATVAIQTTAGVQFSGVVASFTDAGDNPQPGDFTGTIDWGNGTTTAITQIVRDANNPKLFQAFGTITYTETPAQPNNVTVTILNKGIVPATVVSTATVANVPPTGAITGQTTVFAGSPASFRITASDISSTDVTTGFRYSIDWGDNTAPTVIDPTTNNGAAPGTLATKTYAASGNFTITVTITDRNGASSTATLPVAVAPTPTIGSFTVNDRAGGAGTLVPVLTSLGFTISAGGFVLPTMTLANLVLVRNAGEVRPLTGAGFTFNTTTGVGRLDVTSLNLPDGDYELRVNVPNGPTLVQLASVLRGDLNTDGVVDRKDQTLLRGVIGVNPGQPGYLEGSDVNGDGLVNNDDLTALRALNGRRLATVASTFTYNPRRVPKINPVSFGTARVGQSVARDVVIRNTDPTRALVLSNLGFSGNAQFTFAVVGQPAGTREVSIPAGGEIRLRFYLTPTTVGSKFQASATFGIAFPNTTPQFVSILATARVR